MNKTENNLDTNNLDTIGLDILFEQDEKERRQRGEPGQVATRKVGGRIIPITPVACPNRDVFAHMEEEPVCCGTEEEGTCCGDLYSIGKGHVRCDALRHAPMKDKPMVALVSMQNREAPSPSRNMN